jgi:hypothetical protein
MVLLLAHGGAPTEDHSLVIACANEAHCGGCRVSIALPATSALPLVAPIVDRVNSTAVNVTFSFAHGAAVLLTVAAVDGVGNSATAVWTWTVETALPETRWVPPPAFTNDSAPLLQLNCSKPAGCSYEYNLDGTGWRPVGNSSDGPPVAAGADTVVLAAPPLASRSPNATFVFGARVPAGAGDAVAVDVRLNGAATWTPVAVGAEHTVTGLLEGTHVLEARARFVCMRMRGQWVRRRGIPHCC